MPTNALGTADAEALDQLPFKSQNRYSAVRVRTGEGEYVLVMGAAEALRPFVGPEARAGWESAWQ